MRGGGGGGGEGAAHPPKAMLDPGLVYNKSNFILSFAYTCTGPVYAVVCHALF